MPITVKKTAFITRTVRLRQTKVYFGSQVLPTDETFNYPYSDIWLMEATKSSDSTPGYHGKIRRGEHLSDLTFHWNGVFLPNGTIQLRKAFLDNRPGQGDFSVATMFEVWDYPASLITGDGVSKPELGTSANVIQKVLNRAKDNSWNVPVFIAEGKKTVNMLVSTATTMVEAARHLKRGRLQEFWRRLNIDTRLSKAETKRRLDQYEYQFARDQQLAAGNAWLQYKYGWVPLMSDLRSATNTLMDVVELPARRAGRVTASESLTETSVEPWVSGEFACDLVVVTQMSRRLVWRFEPNAADLPSRFGLVNPLEVAWELVPFSFVADWFLPIGDYLRNLDVPFRFKHLGGTMGRKRTVTTVFTGLRPSQSNTQFWTYEVTAGSPTVKKVYVDRDVLSGPPSLSLTDMAFNPNLDALKGISAIALLQQTLGSFKRSKT